MKIKTRNTVFFTINFFFYPSLSLSLYIDLSHSSLRSWLLINFKTFLFFYYFLGNQTEFLNRYFFFPDFYDFRFDFLIKIITIESISPSRYYYNQIFTLFPIQTLWLGISFYFSRFRSFKNLFLISLFLLGLEFRPYSVIHFEYFELLWFCVLRAFNVIAVAFALVKDFMRNMAESYRNCNHSWLLPMNGKSWNERFALNLLDEMPVIKNVKLLLVI